MGCDAYRRDWRKRINTPFSPRGVCQYYYRLVCLFLELSSIQYQLQHLFFLHPLALSVVIRSWYKGGSVNLIQSCCTVQCDWACRQNSKVCELWKTWNVTRGLNWRTCIWHTVQHLQVVLLRWVFTRIDIQTVGLLNIRYFPAFIADYANRGQYSDE